VNTKVSHDHQCLPTCFERVTLTSYSLLPTPSLHMPSRSRASPSDLLRPLSRLRPTLVRQSTTAASSTCK
jgi:hypothetical protein